MKNKLFFGLYDVLIQKDLSVKPNIDYLPELKDYCEQNNIQLFLITGLKENIAKNIISENKLTTFFKEENIINITDDYFNQFSELDLKLKKQKYESEPEHCDYYFKVSYFNNLPTTSGCLYIGHDLWTDAYYLRKFTIMNVILLKETLSYNNAHINKDINLQLIINSNFKDIKKIIESNDKIDYTNLENYTSNKFMHSLISSSPELFSNNILDILKKLKIKKE